MPPAPPGCCACGAPRAPWGLFGRFYCAAHLPAEFWDVKRRAEGGGAKGEEAHRADRARTSGPRVKPADRFKEARSADSDGPATAPAAAKTDKSGQGSLF
ncbi:MAG: hypothetical protein Kow00114_27160 [Kiloniellaceae bacterium]